MFWEIDSKQSPGEIDDMRELGLGSEPQCRKYHNISGGLGPKSGQPYRALAIKWPRRIYLNLDNSIMAVWGLTVFIAND